MKSVFLLFLFCVSVAAQVKRPEPPAVKVPFSESLQAVVVTTDDRADSKGDARLYERADAKAPWKPVGKEFDVVVGRSGLGIDTNGNWRDDAAHLAKKEGDGRSPAGLMPLTYAFGKADTFETKLKYLKLTEFTECVDDSASTHYNRIVHRLQVGIFDWKSSEKMAAVTPEYDLGIFVAYNSYPVVSGNGSCIFLHVWKDSETPTSGCTAMAREDLERILAWLDPNKDPYLIQLPEKAYSTYRKPWDLPNHK